MTEGAIGSRLSNKSLVVSSVRSSLAHSMPQLTDGIAKMKKTSKIEWLIVILIFVVPACGWLVSEIRWSRINNPNGKFTTVSEYLAHGRQPSRVTKVEKEGSTFFIAHSPMDTWIAVPSGPAAYVFDTAGRMMEWSRDTGDDPEFQKKWPLPQEKSSVQELKQIGFQQAESTVR